MMTNGERTITIPRANPINAYKMAGIVKEAGLTGEADVPVTTPLALGLTSGVNCGIAHGATIGIKTFPTLPLSLIVG
ncbi:hypothetical protein [Aphanothece sacrum]|nr:hypothetical protein [Aphanothece sacrum]